MKLNQFAASELFPDLPRWVKDGTNDMLAVDDDDPVPKAVECITVGVISRDRPLIGPIGNFYSKADDRRAEAIGVKQQMTLRRADHDPDFAPTWDISYQRFKKLQNDVCPGTTDHRYFLLDANSMRLNWSLVKPLVRIKLF